VFLAQRTKNHSYLAKCKRSDTNTKSLSLFKVTEKKWKKKKKSYLKSHQSSKWGTNNAARCTKTYTPEGQPFKDWQLVFITNIKTIVAVRFWGRGLCFFVHGICVPPCGQFDDNRTFFPLFLNRHISLLFGNRSLR